LPEEGDFMSIDVRQDHGDSFMGGIASPMARIVAPPNGHASEITID
jgi:hypothetical protein